MAIAIPWENPLGQLNAGIISPQHLQLLSVNARIASASPPKIFTPQALDFLNQKISQGEMYVRIDTAQRLAEEAKQAYPHLETAYNEAFAAPECQRALDYAWLNQARTFLQQQSPKHGSWLNIAEIELSALNRQYLDRRIGEGEIVESETQA